ncbi:MAG: hypothetical protein ACOY4O_10935 [Pseudomonadota bacterium]
MMRLIDDLKDSTGSLLRMTSIAMAAAASLFITTAFLSAAAFVVVLDRYGLMWACLTGAGIYAVLTAMAAGVYLYRKRQAAGVPEKAKTVLQSALADPMVLAAGLQIVRTVGVRRLLPLLAIGGIAVGLMASRAGSEQPEE